MIFRPLLYLLSILAVIACSGPPKRSATPIRVAPALPVLPPPIAEDVTGSPQAWPVSAPPIHAKSAILIDARTGQTIYQKNADEIREVASTQKLLTALIIATRENLDGTVRIAKSDTLVEPVKLGLREGEVYTRRNLLHAVMVKSANDAAAALARDHAGSEAAFAEEMTHLARALGAQNSRFLNAHGLPAPQYSTARDIARIAFRAYREPELRRMMLTRNLSFRLANGRIKMLKATNELLERSPEFTGMKTGYTVAAGRCLVASATINGRELILVQLGSQSKYIFDDAERLLRWAAS